MSKIQTFHSYDPVHDQLTINKALHGDKEALSTLIKTHRDYLYNISLKMYANVDDALDATQEVLIKVITHLKTFQGKSQFRTWLYRIAINHFLNSPRSRVEISVQDNPHLLAGFTEEQDMYISEDEIEEVRVLCSTAMLMCLNREQRLIYVIGEVFEADHKLAADLFDLTPENYRIKLHRARTDLRNFVSNKCGIINPANACRCPKKTRMLIKKGVINKDNLSFYKDYVERVKDLVTENKNKVSDQIQFQLKALFQDSPFQVKKELDLILERIVFQSSV